MVEQLVQPQHDNLVQLIETLLLLQLEGLCAHQELTETVLDSYLPSDT